MASRAEKRKQLQQEQDELSKTEKDEVVEENPGVKESTLAEQVKEKDEKLAEEVRTQEASKKTTTSRTNAEPTAEEIESKVLSTLPGSSASTIVNPDSSGKTFEQVASQADQLVQNQNVKSQEQQLTSQSVASFGEQQMSVEDAYSGLNETAIKEQWSDFLSFLGDAEVKRMFKAKDWQYQLRAAIGKTNFL